MSHRKIEQLFSAFETLAPKAFAPGKRRPRGAKGAGIKFEKEVAKAFGARARHGQWFSFFDKNGSGMCQTDLLIVQPTKVFCFEVKLGNITAGRAQFSELYRPVLERVYKRPVYGIVIARYVSDDPEPRKITNNMLSAIVAAQIGEVPTLHWRERYPMDFPPELC